MNNKIGKEDVSIWKEQALKTLEQAQKLCTAAQSSLESTSFIITRHLPRKLDYVHQTYETLKNQNKDSFELIDELRKEVYDKVISTHTSEYEKSLKPALKKLDTILAELKTTSVPTSLVVSEVGNDESEEALKLKKLNDFISHDAIVILIRNIHIYGRNCAKIKEALGSRFEIEISKVHQQRLKKLNKISSSYNEIVSIQLDLKQVNGLSPFDDNNPLITILKENTSLENELVSLLEMITNHYDQCSKALSLFNSNSPNVENLQVLCEDAKELPDVLKELNAIHEIITNNGNRAHKNLQSKLSLIDKLSAMTQEQLELNRIFKSKTFPKFVIFLRQCKERLYESSAKKHPDQEETSPIQLYTNTLEELVFHYSQFISIYKTKYLQEYHREKYVYPRMYLKKLSDFLKDELEKLQEEENERRREWLAKYGDFIPREFKLPGHSDQPAVVQVITEGLDDIQSSYNEGKFSESINEVELLKFMDHLK